MELYRRRRPKKFSEVVGQEESVGVLAEKIAAGSLPHAVLLCGASGTGKTTLARIAAGKLGCRGRDLIELNCADSRGVDVFRDLNAKVSLAPVSGKCRVWILDEFHRATPDGASLCLKLFEDAPRHAWFFLCTTHPEKLLRTIRTRCMTLALRHLTEGELIGLLSKTVEEENFAVGEGALERIAECSEGSARQALVILDQIASLPADKQLEAVQKTDVRKSAFDLARAVIDKKTKWGSVAKILKDVENEEAEGIRRLILSYSRKALLGGNGRAYLLIDALRDHVYDSGHPGLAASLWEVFHDQG